MLKSVIIGYKLAAEIFCVRSWQHFGNKQSVSQNEKSSSVAKNREQNQAGKYVRSVGCTKNEKARIIKLSDEAMQTLRAIHQESADVRGDALIITTKTGRAQTATNLEYRAAIIFKNAGLVGYTGGLHIFCRTFATRMYEKGARVADIAAYYV